MNNINLTNKKKQIINQLIIGEKNLTQLTKKIKVSKPTMLKYLNELEKNGLIISKIRITKIGREKWFAITSHTQVLSINPKMGIIQYDINEPLDLNNPLIGQIPKPKFRKYTKIYLNKIIKQFKQPIQMIIYGSVARGEATIKSDLDILFLNRKMWNEDLENKIMNALYKGAIETQQQAKPLFKTEDEFIKSNDTITINIKKDGIIIYDPLDSEPLWKSMTKYWSITS